MLGAQDEDDLLEWQTKVRKPCNQKRRVEDSSCYCVYCNRKGMTSCNYEHCPKRRKS